MGYFWMIGQKALTVSSDLPPKKIGQDVELCSSREYITEPGPFQGRRSKEGTPYRQFKNRYSLSKHNSWRLPLGQLFSNR